MSDPSPATPPPAAESTATPAKLGDPFSLGLASFGISALVLASVMSGLVDGASISAVLAPALAVGFLTEMVAGLVHFARGETFAGVVFTAYAGFWLSYALLVQFYAPAVVNAGGDPGNVIGVYLLAWGILSAYLLLAAVRTNLTTVVILVLLTAVFLLAALGSFAASTGLSQAAGYVLVADALAALYASAALIVNDTWGRVVLRLP
jgi:uncharacterized protein